MVSLRLGALYTDIENLPYAEPKDNKHLWIKVFARSVASVLRCVLGKPFMSKCSLMGDVLIKQSALYLFQD